MDRLNRSRGWDIAFLGFLLGSVTLAQTPQGTAFTYQGVLKENDKPTNRLVNLRFELYDASDGGVLLAAAEPGLVQVNDGLFSIELDFGVSPFTKGESRWLEVKVDGTILSPRQHLTAAPYSISTRGLNVDDVGNLGIGTTAPTSRLHVQQDSDTNLSGGLITNSSVNRSLHLWVDDQSHGRIDVGYYADAAILLNGGGAGHVGINTLCPEAPLHIEGSSDSDPSGGGLLVLGGTEGVNLSLDNNEIMARNGGGISDLHLNAAGGNVVVSANAIGNLGIGTTDVPLEDADNRYLVLEDYRGGSLVLRSKYSTGNESAIVHYDGASPAQSEGLLLKSTQQINLYTADQHRMIVDNSGNIGIGTADVPAGDPDSRYLVMEGDRGGLLSIRSNYSTGNESSIVHYDGASPAQSEGLLLKSTQQINLYTADQHRMIVDNAGNVGIGTPTPQASLEVVGTTRTTVLEINGGGDIAEPFVVSAGSASIDQVQPGMVVVIDAERPGALKLSRAAYDRTVAGVISGAGGVNPGLTLRQMGTPVDGEFPIALTGRVYVWCDTHQGADPILPGDLITTSNTAGHAMRVVDHSLATGAILGKAMTPLASGRGLVLVLVSLQ